MAGGSVADRIYSELYEAIRSQRLRPSTSLQEGELARQFSVSRTPVREATSRLVQDGLIQRNGSSYVVRQLSLEDVANIYPIINILEGLAARLAAARIAKKCVARLESLQSSMRDAGDAAAAFVALNQQFHDTIINSASNPALAQEIERFRAITNHFRAAILGISNRRTQTLVEHDRILAALKARDGAAAEAAMRNHVHTAEELLMALLRAGEMVTPPIANRQSKAKSQLIAKRDRKTTKRRLSGNNRAVNEA